MNKKSRKKAKYKRVDELDASLQFVSDSQDVEEIRAYVGRKARNYDAFFVRIGDGDYDEVFGISGIIPYNDKIATRLLGKAANDE